MKYISFSSLHVRLLLLVMLAVIPALGLIMYTSSEQRSIKINEARNDSLQLVKNAEDNLTNIVEGARQLSITLSEEVERHGNTHGYLNQYLNSILLKLPFYANIGVVDTQGNLKYSAFPVTNPLNFSDRLWFSRALQTRSFSVGEYAISRTTNKKSIHFSYPVLDKAKNINAIIFLTLDLDWVNRQVVKIQLPQGATLTVIDSKGTILSRFPEPENWIGKSLPDADIIRTILKGHEGIAEISGVDNIKRLYAFTPVAGTDNSIFVSVGIPKEIVFADVNRILIRNLVLLGLAVFLAFTVAMIIGNLAKRSEDALRASEAELHDHYFTQAAINMILSESLENIPLEEFLQKALNMILSIPWIAFEAIGSISLVEDKADALIMKAQSNIPEPLKELCVRVPFGKCLCGKAAQAEKIQFADHIDERHETCYEGMVPHGHYSVPILSGGRTLGVLNIYLKEGHIRNQKEEEFLNTVANTLAVIIVRRKAEKEKEKLHSQLLQAQKMEAVGQLSGGIAHDFNNILTAIIGYGNLLKMEIEKDSTLSTYIKYILDSAGRAANLTQDLLAFSRKQLISPKPINVNEVIKGAEKILLRLIGADIELSTHLSDKDLIVMADSTQMEHVLMNLATNARDAMPGGGNLLISSDLTEIDERFINIYGYGEKGKYAVITVSDTGVGIDEQTKDKIFEPFFTTKEVGKGTGLGLSMVYGIVKQHDGFINVYSEPGKGTTFKIYLPWIHAEITETKEIELPISKGGIETILVAEDDAMVRKFMREILEGAGYTVIEAKDGEDAIDVFIENKDRIKLLILDVIMPKKNGKEVYETLKESNPYIKALFISGYSADILHKKGIISEGPEVILKPISSDNLLRKIRDLLDK
jgi:signal transduction histidine kinase